MGKPSKAKTMNNENTDTGNAGNKVGNVNRSAPGVSGSLGSLSMLMALEPRFMFDAAVVAEAVEVVSMADSHVDAGGDGVDAGDSGESDGEANFSNESEQTFAQPMAYSPYSGIMPLSGVGTPNEAPTLNTDDAKVVGSEDAPLNITGIVVGDPEGDTLHVTLDLGSETNGRLFLDLAFDSGVSINDSMSDGNSDQGYSKITLVGEASLINKALEKLRYQPVKDSFNADESGAFLEGKDKITLNITVHESDPNKAGWHDAAKGTLDILIKSVNDKPVIAGVPDAGWAVKEDAPLSFNNDIFTITDVDGDDLTVRFEVGNGKLTFDGFDKEIKTDGKTYWEFKGTQAEIKELIGSMVYQGNEDWSGIDTMKITVNDGNIAEPIVKNVVIDVSAVDDPPVWQSDLDQDLTVNEGGATILTEDHIHIKDVDSDDNQITFKITKDFDEEKGVVQMRFGNEWVTLGKNSTFTYQDLKDKRIRYLHSGAQVRDIYDGSTSDTIYFSIDKLVDKDKNEIDGGNFELAVKLSPVNQEPIIKEESNNNVAYEGQGGVKITFELDDPDQDDKVGHVVKITGLPTDGDLYYYELSYKDGENPEDPKIPVEKWVKITQELIDDGFTLDMNRVKAGYLRYYHNGKDGAEAGGQGFGGTRPDSFKVVVTDDGGGTGTPATTGELTVNIEVRPSNDLPTFDGTLDEKNVAGTGNVSGWHTTGVDGKGGNELVVGKDILFGALKTSDDDSLPSSITYTLSNSSSYKGKLYYRTGSEGNYSYREITGGTSFTQADIDAGRIVYCYYGGYGEAIAWDDQGNPTKYLHDGKDIFKFTIRDSSVSVIDGDGYYHEGGFEGGVGQWVGREIEGGEVVGGTLNPGKTYNEGETIPAHWEKGVWVEARKAGPGGETLGDFYTGGQWVGGEYRQGNGEQWVFTEISVIINVNFPQNTGGEGGHHPPPSIGVGEIIFDADQKAVVYEDGEITLTENDLHAWMKYPLTDENGNPHPDGDTLEEEELSLTFRVAKEAGNGYLILKEYKIDEKGDIVYGEDGKVIFTGKEVVLLNNSSFTMRDIMLGAIVYRHDGGEALTDSLRFTISDGTVEYKDGDLIAEVSLDINVIPVNDTPVVGGELTVKEGPTDEQRGKEGGFGDLGTVIGLDQLGDLYDADGDRTGKTEDDPIDNSGALFKDNDFAQVNSDKKFVFIENPTRVGDVYIYVGPDTMTKEEVADWDNWRKINYATEAAAKLTTDWTSANLDGADVVTMDMITNGCVRYIHNGKEVYSDEVLVMVNDGKGVEYGGRNESTTDHPHNQIKNGVDEYTSVSGKHGSSISEIGKIIVTVTPVNDKVTPENNKDLTVDFGQTNVTTPEQYEKVHGDGSLVNVAITHDMLSFKDIDATDKDGVFDPAQIRYTVKEAPKYGTIYRYDSVEDAWKAVKVDTVFSQKDIDNGWIVYIHNGVENDGKGVTGSGESQKGEYSQHLDSFKFDVYDGDQDKKIEDQTFNIKIRMHNEAPILEEAVRDKNYYVDDDAGMSFNGLFNLNDPDYYSQPDLAAGIGNDYMQITLTAKDGAALWGYFSLDKTGLAIDILFPKDSGSDVGMLVIRGSRADLQAALDRVVFLPRMGKDGATEDLNKSIIISLTLNDLANGDVKSKDAVYDDIGGYTTEKINEYFGYYDTEKKDPIAKETTVNITVHVSPMNDAPEFTNKDETGGVEGQKGTHSMQEDSPAWTVVDHENKSLVVSDPDEFNRNINEVAITCSKNGVLSFNGSISGVAIKERGIINGEYVIVLRGNIVDINNALAKLTYKPNENYVGDDVITLKYNDGYKESKNEETYTEWGTGKGGIKSCQSTIKIEVTPVNDAPEIKGSTDILRTEEKTTIPVMWGTGTYLTVGDPNDDPANGGWWQDGVLTVTIVANKYDADGNVKGTYGTLQIDDALFAGLIMNSSNGTDTLVLKGTIAQLNEALKTLKYSQEGGNNLNVLVKLDVEVKDHDNGSDPRGENELKDTFQVTIIVDNKNDIPTLTAPAKTVDMVEDGDKALLFDSNSGFLSVNDVDAFDSRITVVLTVEHGVLSFAGAKSKYDFTNYDTFTIITDKNGKTTVTLKASQDKINRALAELQYKAKPDWYGTDTLTIKTHDAGTPGAEENVDLSQPLDPEKPLEHKYSMKEVTINIAPRNDAPEALDPETKIVMDPIVEDTPDEGKSVYELFKDRFADTVDLNNNNTTSVDNAFIGVWVTSEDTINQAAGKGSWQYLDKDGKWQDIKKDMFLRIDSKIRFKPVDNYNSETESGSGKYLGTVPDLTVKLVESSQVKGDYAGEIKDLDLDALCILVDAAGKEIGKLKTGTTYKAEKLLRDTNNRFTADDLKVTIFVKAANDGPTISYPAGTAGESKTNPIKVDEDVSKNVGEHISFADIDVNERKDGKVTVTLEVGHGTLDLGTIPDTVDVTYSNGKATVVITGTLSEVNDLIEENLTYKGDKDFFGEDTLKVKISDNFYSNSKLPSESAPYEGIDTKDIHIKVDPVNDKPVISAPPTVEVNEDGAITLPDISIADVDIADKSGVDTISVEVSVGHGVLNIVGDHGSAIIVGNDSGSITITGSLEEVNSALAALRYTPAANWNGSDALTIKATDSGLNGRPGTSLSADAKVPITVNPINDAPVVNPGKGAVDMTDILEDVSGAGNPGKSVDDLFRPSFNDNTDSVSDGSDANAFAGVVVVGVKGTAYGRWEFNTGSGWQTMPTDCSDANGFFLAANAQVRFVPNADYNGTEPKLHVRLVDASGTDSGRNPNNPALPASGQGNVNVVGKTGGTFRYSADTVILTQKVVSVNDSPVVKGAVGGGEVVNDTLGDEGRIGGNSLITTEGRTVKDLFGDYFQDDKDGQKTSANPNGSESNSFAGVLITEVNDPSHGRWFYSDDGGSTRTEIVLEAGKGLLLSKDTILYFVAEDGVKGEGAFSLVGRLVDDSAAFAHGTQIAIPATSDVTDAFSEGSIRVKTYILGVNTAPVITVDETPTATERGPMIQLTPGGTVSDIDLEHIDWRGATLVIERESGPNPIDVFGSYNSGVLGRLTEGGAVVVNGQNIGTVEKNSDGTLAITFNANASKALVNDVLNNIGYQYGSHVNAESVTLRYTVNDANGPGYGRQGTGGSLVHSTTQVVLIEAVDEDPIALDDGGSIVLSPEFGGSHSGNVLLNDHDPDGTAVYVVNPTVIQGRYGSVTIDADGNYHYTVDPNIARTLAPGVHVTESFVYTIRDGNNGAPQSANLVIDIVNDNRETVVEPEAPKEIVSKPDSSSNLKDGSLDDVPTPVQDEVNNARESTTENINNVVDTLDKAVNDASGHTDVVYDLDRLTWSEDIYLRSHPDSRNIYHNHTQEFSLPDTMFEHSNPGEVLEYEAVMADGSPLPEWIIFDKDRKSFICQPPADLEGVFEVVVLAKDSQNHFAKANVSIMVRPPEEMANANGFRDPDQIHELGEELGQEELEEQEAIAEGEASEEDVAAETLDEETARLLEELLEEGEPGETENASQPDAADFTNHVARVSNTGLWLRTLELVEDVKTM